jgi:hypothetical protein
MGMIMRRFMLLLFAILAFPEHHHLGVLRRANVWSQQRRVS